MTSLLIFSDPICPWCYIGKKRLDVARDARSNGARDARSNGARNARGAQAGFDIGFRPFMLNPDMPAEGMDRQAYLEAKFGGPDAVSEAYAPIKTAFAEEGIAADPTAMARTPCTLDAHRLIYWAGLEGVAEPVVDALFEAYFIDHRDLSDAEVLADIADSADMDAAVIQRLLASEADIDTVRDADAEARRIGISAVPTFVVAGQHAVPGAQPVELWIRVLDELAEAQP